jgi:septal ring factor EnvC (AmiA/AmiB activator)
MTNQLSQPSSAAAHAVRQFTRQFVLTLTLRHALQWSALWGFVWGTAVLIGRGLMDISLKHLAWGALGWLAAGLAAYVYARRQQPAASTVRAVLDLRSHGGGLLMAEAEQSLGAWQTPAIQLPQVRGRFRQAWTLFAIAAAFLALAFFAPLPRSTSAIARPLDIARETDKLKEDIAALKEAQAIQPEKAETLAQQIQQLQQNASGDDPVKTWEALDQLQAALAQTAQQSAETAAQQQQQLDNAATLADGLEQAASQLDEQTLTVAMQQMAAQANKAAQENAEVAKNLSPELQQALKDGKLNLPQLKELAQALQQGKSALSQRMNKLAQSQPGRMVNPLQLKGGAQSGQRDKSGLAQFLKENAQKQPLDKSLEQWCEGGKGGVDRGRGDAELTWQDPAREDGAKFKEKTLSPAAISELQNSELVGLSATAPTAQPNVAAHGALNGAATGGGSAYTQPVLPRHKGAVQRYFDRKK